MEQVVRDLTQGSEPILTARALARRLNGTQEKSGISTQTLYRMEAAGLIPSLRVGVKGGGVRFLESAVRAALQHLPTGRRANHPPVLACAQEADS